MSPFEVIEDFDKKLFLFLNGIHNESFDFIMLWVSEKYTWIPFYVFLLILIGIKLGWKKIPEILIFIAIVITLSDQLSVHLFKNVFLRYRPCHNIEIQSLVHIIKGCGGKYGFVSSHAANSFALASFAGLLLKDRVKFILPALLIWALLIGYSRIYNGVHYPADIVVGGLLGSLIGYAVFKGYMLYNRSRIIKE